MHGEKKAGSSEKVSFFARLGGAEKKERPDKGNMDIMLLFLVALLLIFGILMLFSASYPKSLNENQNSYEIIRGQIINLFIGIGVTAVMVFIGYERLRVLAWPAMLVAFAMLVVVLMMPEYNGARRWIRVELPFGVFTFQPSEVAKFAIILVFAAMLTGHRSRLNKARFGVAPFMIVLGIASALLLSEPHLSGTILVLGIGFFMMFAGGVPLRYLIAVLVVGMVAAWVVWTIRPSFLNHAFLRIEVFLDLEGASPDDARQARQSLTAIGSGGVFGRGLGKSRQKHMYLPEMHNDYIFAILCEELGLVGAACLIGLFLALLLRCLIISRRVNDRFGSLLVIGVAVQITLQAMLHMAVNAHLIPATGISLPFFSDGGTALILQMAEIGVVLSVSRRADLDSRAVVDEQEQMQLETAASSAGL